MAFYRYYNTWERGFFDQPPILVRQTVDALDIPDWSWTKLEAFVNGTWIDAQYHYSGLWLEGDGKVARIRTPPGQPDAPDSAADSTTVTDRQGPVPAPPANSGNRPGSVGTPP